tara:strand:- start:139 stop:357 length:219 start_codon:yes stop_codon:yes gene_type:complete
MTYDEWKLSNPVDDGYGYDMISNCCGAKMYDDCDICPECKEHCDTIEDYEYEAIRQENYLEERADAKRKYGE